MRLIFLLASALLAFGCAGDDAGGTGKTKPQGRLTDGAGASLGPGFYREGDPASRHQSYLRQGL
jgi:hypothetical protein